MSSRIHRPSDTPDAIAGPHPQGTVDTGEVIVHVVQADATSHLFKKPPPKKKSPTTARLTRCAHHPTSICKAAHLLRRVIFRNN